MSPAKPRHFFDLPGEIRNKIYELVVPETRVVITATHPHKELQALQAQDPDSQHKRPRLRLFGSFTRGKTAPALLSVSRQMNREVVPILYHATTFCFDRFAVLNKFLNRVPAAGARRIVALEITHVGYAEPELWKDRKWKVRHDASWARTLRRVRQDMPSLARFHLDLSFFDWPCSLQLTDPWAAPILALAGPGLDWVDVRLAHDRVGPHQCAVTAKEMENCMMTAAGQKHKARETKRRAQAEKQRRADANKKATKSVRIVLPPAHGAGAGVGAAGKPVKKVRTTGPQGYWTAQPPVAYC